MEKEARPLYYGTGGFRWLGYDDYTDRQRRRRNASPSSFILPNDSGLAESDADDSSATPTAGRDSDQSTTLSRSVTRPSPRVKECLAAGSLENMAGKQASLLKVISKQHGAVGLNSCAFNVPVLLMTLPFRQVNHRD